jgi:hypothetical protein
MCPFSLDIAWLISSFHDDFAPSSTSGYWNELSWPAAQEIPLAKIQSGGNVWKHEQYAIGHYQQAWAFSRLSYLNHTELALSI